MSVNGQIDRIKAAKAAIISAIVGKGVSVPSGTSIDGLGGYVDKIEAASADTCTLKIKSAAKTMEIYCTTLVNGDIQHGRFVPTTNSYTINNVLCGSVFCVLVKGTEFATGDGIYGYGILVTAEGHYGVFAGISAGAGETATIN